MRSDLPVQYLDLTLPTPAENLALDEALLDEAEAAPGPREVLRVWEPSAPCVVLGRSSSAAVEVELELARARGIPVLRRASGGATIVTGPGCLMYAVVLSYERHPQARSLARAHGLVLGRLESALAAVVSDVARAGTSDLVWRRRKFSGNSLRCRRTHFVYHGTLLYDFDLELIARVLRHPPREPTYRGGRPHGEFVVNLPLTRDQLLATVVRAWDDPPPTLAWPRERAARLIDERYGRAAWHAEGTVAAGAP